jgi:hypothetical protein
MKNLKKVLALVLAFAMCFTMFASAATYTDVSSDSQYFNAVTLLSDLGIVTGYTDGTYGPDQTITRAEACALVARMLTGKTDVAEYKGASDFTDVAKDYWGESAIGYCVVNNIVVGDGDGKFRPDDAVTQAEFVTMVTRGLGYETASSPLTYPYGYISAAQDNDVLKDVTIVPSEPALRGMDAVIIYNAIFADYPKMAKYQYVNGVYSQLIPTVADYVYHIVQMGGDDQTYVVVGADAYTKDTIKIRAIETNGNKYASIGDVEPYDTSLTKAQIDSAKYYETKVYYNYDDQKVVALEVLDSQKSYTVTPATYENNSNDSDKKDNKIVLNNQTLNLTEATNLTEDELSTNVAGKAYEKVNFDVNTGNVYNLYDWNGDRYIDYVDVSTRFYAYVASLSGNKISFVLDSRAGQYLPATDFEDGKTYLKTTIDMADEDEHYTWNLGDGVDQGSVVEIDISRVYSDDDKGAHATYTVTPVDTLEGVTFTSVKNGDSDSDGKWYFDDKQYKMSKYHLFEAADDDDESDFRDGYEDNLGELYTIYLDRNGFILYATSADAIIGDYMVVLEADYVENTALETPKAYVLLDNDTYKTLSVDSETDSEYLLYDEKTGFDKKTAALSLVAYKLDDSGKLCDWNNVGNAGTGTKTSYDSSKSLQNKSAYKNNIGGTVTAFNDDTNKISIKDANGNVNRYEISDSAKIFVIAKSFVKNGVYYAIDGNNSNSGADADNAKAYSTSDWKDYTKVVTAGELSDSYKYTDSGNEVTAVGAMFSTTNNTVKALALVGNEDFFNSSSGDRYPAIINSVTQKLSSSSSSKFIYTISAYINGEKKDLTTEAITSSYFNKTLAADFGSAQNCADQLAWVTVNNAGEVTQIEAVNEVAGVPVTNPTTESATRGIVTSKNAKGLTYITQNYISYTDGVAKVITGNKADKTDYQAYASDAAFYIVDNRASNLVTFKPNDPDTDLKTTYPDALDENPEGDYDVSVGTSSNIMTSVINGKTNDIYYVADIFFNDDGDISAVVFYSTAATTKGSGKVDDVDYNLTKGEESGKGTAASPKKVEVLNASNDNTIGQVAAAAGLDEDSVKTLSTKSGGANAYTWDQSIEEAAVGGPVSGRLASLFASLTLYADAEATYSIDVDYEFYAEDTDGKIWYIYGTYTDLEELNKKITADAAALASNFTTVVTDADVEDLEAAIADYNSEISRYNTQKGSKTTALTYASASVDKDGKVTLDTEVKNNPSTEVTVDSNFTAKPEEGEDDGEKEESKPVDMTVDVSVNDKSGATKDTALVVGDTITVSVTTPNDDTAYDVTVSNTDENKGTYTVKAAGEVKVTVTPKDATAYNTYTLTMTATAKQEEAETFSVTSFSGTGLVKVDDTNYTVPNGIDSVDTVTVVVEGTKGATIVITGIESTDLTVDSVNESAGTFKLSGITESNQAVTIKFTANDGAEQSITINVKQLDS